MLTMSSHRVCQGQLTRPGVQVQGDIRAAGETLLLYSAFCVAIATDKQIPRVRLSPRFSHHALRGAMSSPYLPSARFRLNPFRAPELTNVDDHNADRVLQRGGVLFLQLLIVLLPSARIPAGWCRGAHLVSPKELIGRADRHKTQEELIMHGRLFYLEHCRLLGGGETRRTLSTKPPCGALYRGISNEAMAK